MYYVEGVANSLRPERYIVKMFNVFLSELTRNQSKNDFVNYSWAFRNRNYKLTKQRTLSKNLRKITGETIKITNYLRLFYYHPFYSNSSLPLSLPIRKLVSAKSTLQTIF